MAFDVVALCELDAPAAIDGNGDGVGYLFQGLNLASYIVVVVVAIIVIVIVTRFTKI